MKKTTTFRVRMRTKSTFPTDMLRYDHCWPSTTEDATHVAVATRSIRDWLEAYVTCGFTTIQLTGLQKPTADRWLSFGWEVLP